MTAGSLAEAFGDRPDRVPHLQPPAHSDHVGNSLAAAADRLDRLWVAAVTMGGIGHYGAARALLGTIMSASAPGGLGRRVRQARALTTLASHLRQGGRHDLALPHDGRALVLLAGLVSDADSGSAVPADELISARVDALVGVAADNLGLRRFDVADRLLVQAYGVLAEYQAESLHEQVWHWVPRSRLRWGWVHTEMALYRGDAPGAVRAVREPLAAAHTCPSVRHQLKTDLIAAAVSAASGDRDLALARARDCAQRGAQIRQLPLEWAAQTMLVGLGAGVHAQDRAEELRRELIVRGGAFG